MSDEIPMMDAGDPGAARFLDEGMVQGCVAQIAFLKQMTNAREVTFGWVNDEAERIEDAGWWAKLTIEVTRGDEEPAPEVLMIGDCWTPNEALALLKTRFEYRYQTVPRDEEAARALAMESAENSIGRLPPKGKGEHRYVAMATYTLTPGQARMAGVPDARVNLDASNRIGVDIGCLDCEKPYGQLKDEGWPPCEAEAFDWQYRP